MSASLGRLLVVDDNEMNREMLSRRLTRRGYAVTRASDGQQALDLVAAGKFDLVLLDIVMPRLSGWDVLERIRAKHSRLELPVIMVTAKDQSEDVVRAFKEGANDYVTKPLDLEIVLARIGTHVILKRTHQELYAANQKLNDDLASAGRIQQSYLPLKSPLLPGCEIAWRYRPCDELGGDFLNVFDLGTNHIGMYLLDVSGHGVPAALMSMAVSRALAPSTSDTCIVTKPSRSGDTLLMNVTPPGQVADKLNRRFPMDSRTSQYFTLVYGVFDHRSRIFRFVSAGHPSIVYVPYGAEPQLLATSAGPPIGLYQLEDGLFGPYPENELLLQPKDRLYLYSDGVVEAFDETGQLYGTSQLLEQIKRTQSLTLQESVDFLAETVDRWCGDGNSPQDDVSILALEIAH